jgi:hypothetical protein
MSSRCTTRPSIGLMAGRRMAELGSDRVDRPCPVPSSAVVRLEVWLADPISGSLVRSDGCSREFIGWVGLMAAVEWARDGSAGAERRAGVDPDA